MLFCVLNEGMCFQIHLNKLDLTFVYIQETEYENFKDNTVYFTCC